MGTRPSASYRPQPRPGDWLLRVWTDRREHSSFRRLRHPWIGVGKVTPGTLFQLREADFNLGLRNRAHHRLSP